MAPVPTSKVKRIKKSGKRSSTAAVNAKPKWEKPNKSISAKSGVAKIQKVNKKSFDPIKAQRGVVLLKNIPHGFYEDEMRAYFGQFGMVTRVRVARSERTGRSKGFGYIEFKVPDVAAIAADTMNNYMMFKHVLKAVYIPPEKQTHNFFRRDVTFTSDSNGETSFTSTKIKNIEKAIDNFNRVPTDEEHAKRMKRTQKTLQKQQKKYGVDLSNVLVSGTSSSSDAATTPEVKTKESKKKATVAKKSAEKKPETKRNENKVVAKKDKKKSPANEEVSSNDGGNSLLQGLLDKTYETDTSDEDFKLDHSFNASVEGDSEDSSASDGPSFADVLAKKLSKSKKLSDSSFLDASLSDDDEESDEDDEGSDDDIETEDDVDTDGEDDFEIKDYSDEESENDGESDVDGESDDVDNMEFEDDSEEDDDESEEDEPVRKPLNDKKKGLASNGAVDTKPAKGNLKRKLKVDSSSIFSALSKHPKLDIGTKKQKQSPTSKKDVLASVKVSLPEPVMSKKKQEPKINKSKKNKPNRPEKAPLSSTTSSSEPESLPPQKQKKANLASKLEMLTKLPSEPSGKQKMKKKQAKQSSGTESSLSSPMADTTSSEQEMPKQKLNKKSKVNVASSSEPEALQKPKAEKKNKKLDTAAVKINEIQSLPKSTQNPEARKSKNKIQLTKDEQSSVSTKTFPSTLAAADAQKTKKKQPSKEAQKNVSQKAAASTPTESEAQKAHKKNKSPKEGQTSATSTDSEAQNMKKQKPVGNGKSATLSPEAVKADKKNKKIKPVKSSLIAENGFTKKSVKLPTKVNKSPEKPKKSSAWSTVSETDGEDTKHPKVKGLGANLKTIVHKSNSKKKAAKSLDAKKVKQTPDELLQLITSKDLKQKTELKSKKKFK